VEKEAKQSGREVNELRDSRSAAHIGAAVFFPRGGHIHKRNAVTRIFSGVVLFSSTIDNVF